MSNTLFAAAMFVAFALTTGPAALAQRGGPVESGSGSLAAARKYLEGRWSLISFEVRRPESPPLKVEGAGTLTYDGFGNLDIDIRTDPATGLKLADAGVPNEKGVISTRGRAAVDMQRRTLTYFIQGQPPLGAPSGPLALNRQRHWEVDGDLLTLTTRGDDGQPLSVARWRKLSGGQN